MNTYRTSFTALCPVNGATIEYRLHIHTGLTIEVEKILAAVRAIGSGFHEDIADKLLEQFGGSQTLVADHHGVTIETIRPFAAHWMAATQPQEAKP